MPCRNHAKARIDSVPSGVESLSLRQMQCLYLAARGAKNAQIARRLGFSVYTVRGYLRAAYGKLGVSDRTQAVVAVLKYVSHPAMPASNPGIVRIEEG